MLLKHIIRLVLVLIFSNVTLTGVSHGSHIAEYYYQLDGEYLNLKFVIEKEVFMDFDFQHHCGLQSMTPPCATQYINEHLSITIDGQKPKMELLSSSIQYNSLVMHLRGVLKTDEICEIIVENRCFYEFDHDFKNRILLDIAQFKKSYLLNKKRNRIELQ